MKSLYIFNESICLKKLRQSTKSKGRQPGPTASTFSDLGNFHSLTEAAQSRPILTLTVISIMSLQRNMILTTTRGKLIGLRINSTRLRRSSA